MTRRTFFSALAGIAAALAFPYKRRAASAVAAAVTTTRMNVPVYTVYRHSGSCIAVTLPVQRPLTLTIENHGTYKISGDEVTLIRVEPP